MYKNERGRIMSYYSVMAIAGIFALLGITFLAGEECRSRQKAYAQKLHTELVLHDVPGEGGSPSCSLACTLYRTHNVIGRRKRRSDICLACYRDGCISRNHAVLLYDGEHYRIKPAFRFNGFRHAQILVENEVVPPQGMIIRYGDRIAIAGHILQLVNTNEPEMGW